MNTLNESRLGPVHGTRPADVAACREALQALKDILERDFTVILVTSENRIPHLTISSCHAQLGEDVYADYRYYWWPWGQPIAAANNPQAAATRISHVLSTIPEPTHG